MTNATFSFTADPEKLTVAVGEIVKSPGLTIVSQSSTSMVVQVETPWPTSRLDGAEKILSFFVNGLVRS